jgi:HSP20 family protein
MFYRTLFPRELFAQLDRLQREPQQTYDQPTIRGFSHGSFPAMNVGSTAQSLEIYAFVPGIDAASIDVQLEKGVLTITGERKVDLPAQDDKTTLHLDERFAGRFRRVVALPDDIDTDAIEAQCRDGVLHVSLKRRAEAQARRIAVH